MPFRIAVVGFRHAHILGLYRLLEKRPDIAIVASCEEDAETRNALSASGVTVTHECYKRMLADVECDIVA